MIITIARQCGCGAFHVGKILAENYGVPFYTRQNLMEMADKNGVIAEMDDFFEERPVDELLFSFSSSLEDARENITAKPLKILSEMIGTDDCIIIGRCGNHIFRKRNDLISVFLKGDIDLRIENIKEKHKFSIAKATEFVHNVDDCRITYHKYYTGLTWGNAVDYDICLDSCRLGTEQTANMIEQYVDNLNIK